MPKKTAMASPLPAKLEDEPTLVVVLELLGNDRPFTEISHRKHEWIIHFLGDEKPTTITFSDGKWKVK